MNEQIFTNAKLVLPEAVVHGTIVIRDGKIAEIDASPSALGTDLEGDYLLPGFVELHTDHVEGHYSPRPGVKWNPLQAALAHDAQIASSGITTVFDALCVGMDEDRLSGDELLGLIQAMRHGSEQGIMRADHFTHLRCEVSAPDVVDAFMKFDGEPSVRLASLMDHTPGQRQFRTLDQHRLYYQGKTGMSDREYETFVRERQAKAAKYSEKHRAEISALCEERGIMKASHDDATEAHVAEAVRDNVVIAEFPTTEEAAKASTGANMHVLMGAPNVVRGKSHSGNISALELADLDALNILSSDYIPMSLVQAVFLLAENSIQFDLPKAVKTVSQNPADAMGLKDRGRLETDKRADMVQVKFLDETPVIRHVWREGQRVA